jgi:hypothetical protein
MAIYIDSLQRYGTGLWCHMATDGSLDELHAFAAKIGLKRAWFQDHARVPHYDLRPGKRLLAVKAGAIQVSSVELAQKCRKVEK